jgi:hypothetical protein
MIKNGITHWQTEVPIISCSTDTAMFTHVVGFTVLR